MKRAIAAILAVVGSLLVATAPASGAPAYCGTDDVYYPVIKSTVLSPPSQVTIGRANKVVTVTVKASDDCAIERILVVLAPRGVKTARVIYLSAFQRIAGTSSDGTWRARKTILDEQLGGVWEILRVDVTDTYFNMKQGFKPPGTVHLRHETRTTVRDPRSPVKKTATIVGRLRAYGDFGTWTVQLQSRKSPGKKWKKVKNLTTNTWGDFGTRTKISGTTYFRVVHFQSYTTVGSVSRTVKVKKKR